MTVPLKTRIDTKCN